MLAQALLGIARDAQIRWLPPRATDQGVERVGVGRGDLAAGEDFVGAIQVHDFVARSHERDSGGAVHERGGVGDRREDAELSRPQRGAGGKDDRSRANILAAIPHVLAGIPPGHDGDAARRGALGVLLADDRIGPRGERCTGEDAGRFTRPDRPGGELSGRDAFDDRE